MKLYTLFPSSVAPRSETTTDRARPEQAFGMWLRQVWNAVVRTAEAIEQSPIEELLKRISRLEQQVEEMKTKRIGD
jgi:polyhydroxyalkanoate synthesis regulator phasin